MASTMAAVPLGSVCATQRRAHLTCTSWSLRPSSPKCPSIRTGYPGRGAQRARTLRVLAAADVGPASPAEEEEDVFQIPVRLNNTPHPREVRRQFYEDATASFVAAYRASEKRMQMKVEFPELNTEQDVYRIGTFLEMIREFVSQLTMDGKTVKVCVQSGMGQGVFQGLPLQLSGVDRILKMMDWGECLVDGEPQDMLGTFVKLGSIGKDDIEEGVDCYVLVAPQNIVGYSILPDLRAMEEAAGDTPMLLVNPKLGDIPSANNVMSVRGRAGREAYKSLFKTIYHFRLLYKKPFWFPIFGAIRYPYGKNWQLYKRFASSDFSKQEEYALIQSYPSEPSSTQITEAIQKRKKI